MCISQGQKNRTNKSSIKYYIIVFTRAVLSQISVRHFHQIFNKHPVRSRGISLDTCCLKSWDIWLSFNILVTKHILEFTTEKRKEKDAIFFYD